MMIEQRAKDGGQPCGMRHYVEVFALMEDDERLHRRFKLSKLGVELSNSLK